ncbi:integrase core domain-containing protein [Pedobacter lusitanus]|uniref:integrase core domain-containing protein n=1 Tax=Pedobacter lusitanus TaxID=1503925 RepID=UPI0009E3E179
MRAVKPVPLLIYFVVIIKMQNGYIERFNRSFRESILNAYLFEDIMQVQILAEEWVKDYNSKRPHEALDGKTPLEYRAQWSLSMEQPLRS